MFGENNYLNLGNIPSAVKTGTTQEYRDAWTVGYTSDIVVGVWVGNNDNSKMYGAAGVKAAAPIWNNFIKKAYEIKEWLPKNFKEPEPVVTEKPILNGSLGGVVKIKIDKMSGKRTTEYTPAKLIEEKLFYEPHSLLYFVKKDDPQGDAPSDPSNDPQFSFWEEGVQKWIENLNQDKNNDNEYTFGFEPAPKEYDDIHTKEDIPKVLITQPNPNSFIQKGSVVLLSSSLEYVFPIKKVEIFFDEEIVKTLFNIVIENKKFSTLLKIPSIFIKKENPHTIKVRVFDEALNKGEDSVGIFIR